MPIPSARLAYLGIHRIHINRIISLFTLILFISFARFSLLAVVFPSFAWVFAFTFAYSHIRIFAFAWPSHSHGHSHSLSFPLRGRGFPFRFHKDPPVAMRHAPRKVAIVCPYLHFLLRFFFTLLLMHALLWILARTTWRVYSFDAAVACMLSSIALLSLYPSSSSRCPRSASYSSGPSTMSTSPCTWPVPGYMPGYPPPSSSKWTRVARPPRRPRRGVRTMRPRCTRRSCEIPS